MAKQRRRAFMQTVGAGSLGAMSTRAVGATTATTITIEGSGADIWNDTDAFHYFYEEVDGDFDVAVKVDGLENTDAWAKAGLMVRQSLADDEEHAMIRKTPGNETSFQWRSDSGDEAESTTSDSGEDQSAVSGGTITATWQRLVRDGDTIRAYGSSDGDDWTLIGEISPSAGTIDFAGSAYVGLAVTSHDEGTLCTAAFSNLSGLSPTENTDVGDVVVAGSVTTSDGGSGGGSDPTPVVSTGSASNVTHSSVSLGGAVDDLGEADEVTVSFEYRVDGVRSWAATPAQTLSEPGTFSYQLTELSPDTAYEFRAVLEASDGDADAGSINTFETAVEGTEGIVVEGAGADIWNRSDEGHYYFTDVSGDFDGVVAVDSLEDTDEWAKAGLQFRESLEPEAANVMIRRTPGHDTSVQWRSETGGDSTSLTANAGRSEREISGGTIDAAYQRLVRSGDTFLAYASEDGYDWTLMAALSTDAIDVSEDGYLGLAVTSHNEGTLCAAEFSELGGVSPTHNQDIGDVDVAGSVSGDDGAPVDTNPVVATASAANVGSTTATLVGRLDSLGEAASAAVNFEYRAAGTDSWTATSGQALAHPGSFSADVADLSSETDYEFRAIVNASDGDTDTGAVATFTTGEPDTGPVVTTDDATDVDATSATLHGRLERLGGNASAADIGFEVRPVADDEDEPEWNRSSTETLSDPDEYEGNVVGLSSETDYEYRALAEADDGDVDTGEIASFTTGEAVNRGGSHYDYTDGFTTPAPWLETEDVDVYRVQEATRSAVEEAFHASGPRVVVFETSGVIDLGGDRLDIDEDKCWVAGQTAPSPGITFINGMLAVDANDCVVQHIRSRIGPGSDGNIQGNDSLNTQDETTNNVVDHVTASWGTDECMSVGYDTDRTTYTNNLIYEGLYDPYGDGSDHNYGTLVGDGADRVTLAGNVWAKCRSRMPRLKSDTRSVVANNLCYFFDEGGIADGSTETSFVGNAYLGSTARDDNVLEDGNAYLADNTAYDPSLDPDTDFASSDELSSPPLWPDGLETMPSSEVERHNLQYAGARPADRTANDERIIREIANRAGNDRLDSEYDYWIPHPDAVGGYPDLPENTHSLSVPDSGLREWLEGWALAVEEPGASPP